MYVKYDTAKVRDIVDKQLETILKSHAYDEVLAKATTQAMKKRAFVPDIAVIWPIAFSLNYESALKKLGLLCSQHEPCTQELQPNEVWEFLGQVAEDLAGLFNNLAKAYLSEAFGLCMGHNNGVFGVTVFMYDELEKELWHHEETLEERWGYDFGPQGLCLLVDDTEWHIPHDERSEWYSDEEWIEHFDAILNEMGGGIWHNQNQSVADPYTLVTTGELALGFSPAGNTPQSFFQHVQYSQDFLDSEHEVRISIGDLNPKARRDIINYIHYHYIKDDE